MAKKKEKNKKKFHELVNKIKEILNEPKALDEGLTSLEIMNKMRQAEFKTKKETIESWLEIFMILELVGKKEDHYFYQPPKFHSVPLDLLKETQSKMDEIFFYAGTGSQMPVPKTLKRSELFKVGTLPQENETTS